MQRVLWFGRWRAIQSFNLNAALIEWRVKNSIAFEVLSLFGKGRSAPEAIRFRTTTSIVECVLMAKNFY